MILFEEHRSDKSNYLYHQLDTNLNFQKHMHRSFEFICVFSGNLLCQVEDKNFYLSAGQALLILPGQIHSYQTKEYSESYLCVFSNDYVSSFSKELNGRYLSNPSFTFTDFNLIKQLQNPKTDKYTVKSILYGICGMAYSRSTIIQNNNRNSELVNRIASYVQDNFMCDISLKQITEEFGYSYYYLSSFFNKNFGISFSSYVNRYRAQYASHLLRETDATITEIASMCGFASIRNFNRVFKGIYGDSPRAYRQKTRMQHSP
ncbi:MAG: AraC family transcriptional regulator [Clostridiaceae bacterium]|nr:AraC family transcriptional regulator [Clostridiaceae bacterium]